jgi:fermentation-respiration switch protein FrsA (DUF1100 family)
MSIETQYKDSPVKSQDARLPRTPTPEQIGLGVAVLGAGIALSTLGMAWFSTHPVRLPVYLPRGYSLPVEEVAFPSRDGLCLSGWFAAAAEARGGVILCHGHPGNRMEALFAAQTLHDAGFHVLLFDFRALGQSEGTLSSIGFYEVNDLLGAADYLHTRPEMAGLRMGVFGISMGGAVSIMTAAQDPRFEAVVTHGAYASLDRAIENRGRYYLGPFGKALSIPVTKIGRRWIDVDPRDVAPVDVISRVAPRPVLLIHGERDRIIRPDNANDLYEAARAPRQIRFLPRSWHFRIHPEEQEMYRNLLVHFYQTHL